MKSDEGGRWEQRRAMKAEDLATLKPCTTINGEGGEEKGWKAARQR
jgi:hypothetical protein